MSVKEAKDMQNNGSKGVPPILLPTTPSCAIIFEVVERHRKKLRKNKCLSNLMGEAKTLDNVISRIIYKCIGR